MTDHVSEPRCAYPPCSRAFEPDRRTQRYCSARCYSAELKRRPSSSAALRARLSEAPTAECAAVACSVRFVPRSINARYCSEGCLQYSFRSNKVACRFDADVYDALYAHAERLGCSISTVAQLCVTVALREACP